MMNCSAVSGAPLWWLETDFGIWVFVLIFLTWGLLIVTLILNALYLIRKLSCDDKVKKVAGPQKKKQTKKT